MLKALYTFFLSVFLLVIFFTSNVNSQASINDASALTVVPNTYSGTPGTATFPDRFLMHREHISF